MLVYSFYGIGDASTKGIASCVVIGAAKAGRALHDTNRGCELLDGLRASRPNALDMTQPHVITPVYSDDGPNCP